MDNNKRFILIFSVLTTSLVQSVLISETTIENKPTLATPIVHVDSETTIPAPLLSATAAKLVRYRIVPQPPITIIRHTVKSSKRPKVRRRIKRPKQKYIQPSYSYTEPVKFYKQPKQSRKPPASTSYTFDELDFDAGDYHLPSSSYDTQPVDFDFYGDQNAKPKVSSYRKSPPRIRRPHKSYGIPKEYSTPSSSSHKNVNFEHINEDGIYSSESAYDVPYPPLGNDDSPDYRPSGESSYSATNEESYAPSSEERPTSYESFPPYVPESNLQQHQYVERYRPTEVVPYEDPTYNNYEAYPPMQNSYLTPPKHQAKPLPSPPQEDSFFIYDKKLSNSGYKSNQQQRVPEPTRPDVQITYAPSYEINPVPTQTNHHNVQLGGNFAEPPGPPPQQPPPPPSQQAPPHNYFPPDQQELPLNHNHNYSPYDHPKNSYEVPLYDPIPFNQQSPDQQIEYNYPPYPFNDATSQSTQKHLRYQQHSEEAQDSTNQVENISIQYHPKQKHNHRNRHHKKKLKNQPPIDDDDIDSDQSAEPTSVNYIEEHHLSTASTSSTRQPRRKRKRIRLQTPNKIHNLDVPELEHAFKIGQGTASILEPMANESENIESKQNLLPVKSDSSDNRKEITDFSRSQSWNPMKIRNVFRKTPSSTTSSSSSSANKRQKVHIRTTPSSRIAADNSKNVEIVSIEKSKSQSYEYYDGTLAPEVVASVGDNSRMDLHTMSSGEGALKRTTKSIFNTTYFKSPKNDAAATTTALLEQSLPKNHKLF